MKINKAQRFCYEKCWNSEWIKLERRHVIIEHKNKYQLQKVKRKSLRLTTSFYFSKLKLKYAFLEIQFNLTTYYEKL